MKNAGRPTSYTPDHARTARLIYETGATDEVVARILGVHVETLRRWRDRYPEFDEAARAGKTVADDRVLFSLYRRAVGYDYTETKAYMPHGAKEPIMVDVTRHKAADVRAAMQWLRQRLVGDWADNRGRDHNADLADRLAEALANVEAWREVDDNGLA